MNADADTYIDNSSSALKCNHAENEHDNTCIKLIMVRCSEGGSVEFHNQSSLESAIEFDAILSIIIELHMFTELSSFLYPGGKFRSIWFFSLDYVFVHV